MIAPYLHFFQILMNRILIACTWVGVSIFLASCDRIEGKAKDLANNTVQAVQTKTRDIFVSDLQKDARSMCINALTATPVSLGRDPFMESRYPNYVPEKLQFELGKGYDITVDTYGDGKYRFWIPLFRQDKKLGMYRGYCAVENGQVIETGASSS